MKTSSSLTFLICQTALVAGLLALGSLPASAQTTTLRNPYLPNVSVTAPETAAPTFPPPPPGDGCAPPPVTPGMTGNPGYEPFVPYLPATTINLGDTYVALPANSTTSAPGCLGPSITIPPPPSTPGCNPGNLTPNNSGYQPPAIDVNVPAGGGSLGADQAPTKKWGGQTTKDFGRNINLSKSSGVSDFGVLLQNAPGLAQTPQYSQDGVRPTNYGLTRMTALPSCTAGTQYSCGGTASGFDIFPETQETQPITQQ